MLFFRNNLAFILCLLVVLSSLQADVTAQTKKYEFYGGRDIPLLGIGAAGGITSLVLRNQNDPFDLEGIKELKIDQIPLIDQSATNNFSTEAQFASDVLLTASYVFPFSTLLLPEARQEFGLITLMAVEGILINETFTGITKSLVNRARPYTYNENVSDDIRLDEENNLSFFSGHTSYTAMFSFLSAQILTNYIDDPTGRKLVWAGAILWPAATGYFRYRGGVHFVTDVLAGYAVGAAIGYFIPLLHEKKEEKTTSSHKIQLDREASHMFKLVFVF